MDPIVGGLGSDIIPVCSLLLREALWRGRKHIQQPFLDNNKFLIPFVKLQSALLFSYLH